MKTMIEKDKFCCRTATCFPFIFLFALSFCCQEHDSGIAFEDQGQSSDADSDGETGSDTKADSGIEDAGVGATGPGASLVGTWGQLIGVAVKQTGIPILGSQIVDSRTWQLVKITTDNQGHLTAHETVCGIKLKLETWLSELIIPKNFVEHLNPVDRHISVSSEAPGTPWISDTVYEIRGAKLADAVRDPLPGNNSSQKNDSVDCAEASMGAQCDQDEDGHPGVTNRLSPPLSCEVYVAQRWWSKFGGTIVDKDLIEGDITDSFSEQTVLAASTSLCQSAVPGTAPVIAKCPKHFYFKLLRLSNAATCDDVMALTSCDENHKTCANDDTLPLNPRLDSSDDCK